MTLDYSGHLVLTVGNIPEARIPQLLSVRDETVHNHVTDAPQCFVHGAGPGKVFVAHVLNMLQRAQEKCFFRCSSHVTAFSRFSLTSLHHV